MDSAATALAARGPGGGFQPGQMPAGGPPGGFGGRGGAGLLFGPLGGTAMLVLFALTLIVLAIVFFKVFSRTGRSGALGLLMLVPVVNLGVLLWWTFSQWPIEAEVERLKTLLAVQAAQPNTPIPEQG